jgi:hypothetical protein
MPQTQINCPRCRQPITAQVDRLFDITNDPGAKQRLLGAVSNYVRCPFCRYEGTLATPIVYHDANKELLLTYFPPELNIPLTEQEKIIGPLINQVTNRLLPEKRKAYLLSPRGHLTYQSLIERVLNADGITPEMIKAQQERLALIDRLLAATSDEARSEIIKQNGILLDEQFFALFSRLMQSTLTSGQEELAKQMNGIQKKLLTESEFGQKIQTSVGELEAAAKSLQDAGKELTREKLLELIIAAPNDDRLKGLVSLARQGLDYVFFQTLTERIESKQGDEKKNLEDLRGRLLDYVNEIDHQIEERLKQAQGFIESILTKEDIRKATTENIAGFSQDAIEVLNSMSRQAKDKKDKERLGKLEQVIEVLKEVSVPPPEYALIEQLLDTPDTHNIERLLEEHGEEITPHFMELLSGLVAQMEAKGEAEQSEDKAVAERLRTVYRLALRFSMKKQMG